MPFVHLFLVIAALVCLLMAAVGVVAPRGNLLAMGIFLWVLSTLVGGKP